MVRVFLFLVLLAAAGCGSPERPADPRSGDASRPPSPRMDTGSGPNPVDLRPSPPRIVALGDSLTAGLGLAVDEAYPSLLQRKLKSEGLPFEVVNAGVSGDTSADGLRRTGWALEGDVRLLIIALGANDGLRGLPPAQMEANLQGIIDRARQRAIAVILVGMEAPPNYGEQYAAAFRQVFRDLAVKNKVAFVPFLLDGVAGDPELNQGDGIHPNRAGAARIAEHLWPAVKTALEASR